MPCFLLYHSGMRHVYSVAIALVLFGIGASYYAQVFSYQVSLEIVVPVPDFVIASNTAPTVSVSAYLIFDVATGRVLAQYQSDTVYPIASITKLFTATAILENFNPESMTTITMGDVAGEGEAGKLESGEVYTYRELLFPLLLESSNDAALALDHATNGTLVPLLGTVAAKYGAKNAWFADAAGLSTENQATARDLMAFSQAVGERYPFVYDISGLPQYIGAYTGWRNNNPVFDSAAYRGGKHGYTPDAGRTIVARFAEPFTAGERTIGYIILGSDNLPSDIAVLRQFVADAVDYQ